MCKATSDTSISTIQVGGKTARRHYCGSENNRQILGKKECDNLGSLRLQCNDEREQERKQNSGNVSGGRHSSDGLMKGGQIPLIQGYITYLAEITVICRECQDQ